MAHRSGTENRWKYAVILSPLLNGLDRNLGIRHSEFFRHSCFVIRHFPPVGSARITCHSLCALKYRYSIEGCIVLVESLPITFSQDIYTYTDIDQELIHIAGESTDGEE